MDRLKGLVILLMALDHSRDFFQPQGANPEDPLSSTPAFFLMRWITHLCAPLFILLAGAGARVLADRWSPAQLRVFLLKRGLWLMLLEATWVSFSWHFHFQWTYLGVLWSIGGSMLLLALVCDRSDGLLLGLALGSTLILAVAAPPSSESLLHPLLQPSHGELWGHRVQASYVILPWAPVMLLGYAVSGALLRPDHRLLRAGGGCLLLFLLLRGAGLGDPSPPPAWPWEGLAGFIGFFNPAKYPPSMCFLLMTLGLGGLALYGLQERVSGGIFSFLEPFGRVPMFFYLLHLPLIHAAGLLWSEWRYQQPSIPAEAGLSLGRILIAWLLLCLFLYPLCRWWGGMKRRHPSWRWMAYL